MNFIGFNALFTAAGSTKLRHRFIALVVALLGVAFLTVALLSFLVSRARIHDVIASKELPLTSDLVYAKIQRDFARHLQASAVMAHDPFLREWIVGGEKDAALVQEYLADMQQVNNAFTAYFVSARTHRYYVPKGILKTVARTDDHDGWFFALENANAPYTVEVDTDQTNDNALTVFINYRVFDKNNTFLGIAGVGLNVDAVRAGLAQYRRLYDVDIYFIDRAGKRAMGATPTFPDIQTVTGLSDLAPHILSGDGGAFEYARDGQTRLLNVRMMPELNWYLMVEATEDAALNNLRHVLMLNLLIAAVATATVALLLAMMVTRFRAALDKVATIDPLTGLTNRHAFPVLFDQTVKADRRVHRPTSLVLFDIDKLRAVNTMFGHASGDKTLKSVAEVVEHHSRPNDVVCRWGGDQIILLLKDCTMNKAMALADTIRQEIERIGGGDKALVTVSGGAAEIKETERAGSVLARAEEGLRAARVAGGNCVISSGRSFEH